MKQGISILLVTLLFIGIFSFTGCQGCKAKEPLDAIIVIYNDEGHYDAGPDYNDITFESGYREPQYLKARLECGGEVVESAYINITYYDSSHNFYGNGFQTPPIYIGEYRVVFSFDWGFSMNYGFINKYNETEATIYMTF